MDYTHCQSSVAVEISCCNAAVRDGQYRDTSIGNTYPAILFVSMSS